MTTYTWTDNAMRSGSACDVDKVADNLMHLKYDNVSPQDGKVPYSVNSGKQDSNGYANFIQKDSDTQVTILAGGSNLNLVIGYPDGSTETISSNLTVDSISDNKNTVFIKEKGNNTIQKFMISQDITTSAQAISGGDQGTTNAKENAFNNDGITSVWASLQVGTAVNGNAYIGQNFGTPKSIKKATLWMPYPDYSISSVKFQTSTNGTVWTDVQTFTIDTLSINTLIMTTPVSAQYARFLANSPNLSSMQWVVAEIEMLEAGSNITESLVAPTGGEDGDYWLNYGIRPYKPYKKVSGSWTETQFVKLGEVAKTNGTLGTPISYAFNGVYDSGDFSTTSGNNVSKNHNIDTNKILSTLYENNVQVYKNITPATNTVTWTSGYTGTSRIYIKRSF